MPRSTWAMIALVACGHRDAALIGPTGVHGGDTATSASTTGTTSSTASTGTTTGTTDKGTSTGGSTSTGATTGKTSGSAATGTTTGGTTDTADTSITLWGGAPDCKILGPVVYAGVSYTTVQDGIDAALGAADTVWVCPGTYVEDLYVPGDRRIEGVGGSAAVTLEGTGLDSVIVVGGGALELVGVTVTGGGLAVGGAMTDFYGGGINGELATDLVLDDCVITSNTATDGGGIYIGLSAHISDSVITGNYTIPFSPRGGGIAMAAYSVLELADTEVSDNFSSTGAGLHAEEQTTIIGTGNVEFTRNGGELGAGMYLLGSTVSGVNVYDNEAYYVGGGVLMYNGGAVIDSSITGNTAPQTSGLGLISGSYAIEDVTVDGNSVFQYTGYGTIGIPDALGGGVVVSNADVTATGTVLVTNNYSVGPGGGIAVFGDSVWTGTATVSGNVAGTNGGGLYVPEPYCVSVSIDDLVVDGNEAADNGGGLYSGCASANLTNVALTNNTADLAGGGLSLADGGGVTADQVVIDGNDAPDGAGIYITDASTLTLLGGAVTANGPALALSGGGATVASGVLDAQGTDFGDALTDNLPDDVYVGTGAISYTGYTAAETFTCDELACTPPP